MARRYSLAWFIVSVCLVAGQPGKYALKGEKFIFKPDISGRPDGILWKHNGNKVVEFNGQEEQVYSPFDNRITLDWVSAELHISGLRSEDSGDYELDIDINKGLHRSKYSLEVIDKVTKPTISCEMKDGSSSNSSAELVCSSEPGQPQSLTKFEWKTHGNVKPGPNLKISLGDERDDEVYSCSVSNPLSSETTTFTAKDCYPDKSSTVALIATLVIIGILLVCLGVLFWKLRHKVPACLAKRDLEKQPPSDTEEDKQEEEPLTGRNSDKQEVEPPRGRSPDKQEKEPLKSTSPACDMERQEETPRQGHVKDAKIRLNIAGLTLTEKHTEDNKRPPSLPSPPPPKSPSSPDRNNPASNDDGDADADQHREPPEEDAPHDNTSDSQRSNQPEPDSVSDKLSEDKQPDMKSSIAPEQPACDKDKQEETPQQENHTEDNKRPSPPPTKSPSSPDRNNPASNDDGDADADQHRELPEEDVPHDNTSDSQRSNQPEPDSVSHKLTEDKKSDLDVSIPPEQPACDKAKQEETPQQGHIEAAKRKSYGENNGGLTQTENHTEDNKRPASPPSPPPPKSPSSPLDRNNPASNDDGDADADQHRELPEEDAPHDNTSDSQRSNQPEPDSVSDKLREDKKSDLEVSTAPEQPEPEKEADEDEKPPTSEKSPAAQTHSPKSKSSPPEDGIGEHVEDAGVTGDAAEKNERESDLDDSNKVKLLSTVPEQTGSKTRMHDMNSEEEPHTNKDNQQETVKPLSADEDEIDLDLYSAGSQQPQSPTPTEPDNRNSDTFKESPDATHADPDQEEKEEDHKPKSEGQSDKGEGETVEGKNEVQRGLKEEKPSNESLNEEEEGRKKDEDVA